MQYIEPNPIEIDIRGRFMAMACDVEWSLLFIMAYASPNPNKSSRLFEKMTMGKKIEKVICDLKKYKPDHYEKNKESLEKLWEFGEIRNEMAHYRMTVFDYGNSILLEMKYMGEENHLEVRKSKDYTIEFINDTIKRFNELNLIFSGLAKQLKSEYLLSRGIIMKNNRITLTPNWKPVEIPERPDFPTT